MVNIRWAIRTLAERECLPLIDLTKSTTELYNAMGDSLSKRLFVHFPANSYSGQDKELKDDTHSNAFGAYEICKLVIMGLKSNNVELVKYLRSNWRDFHYYNYDDWQKFYWPMTPINKLEKPAGD